MIALLAVMSPEKGSRMAARVSMDTPGMAPKSMPPSSPPAKISADVGSPKRVSVPAMKFSMTEGPPLSLVPRHHRMSTSSQLLMS